MWRRFFFEKVVSIEELRKEKERVISGKDISNLRRIFSKEKILIHGLNRSLFFVAKIFSGGAREIQKVDLHCTVWQVPVSSLPSRVTAR